MNIKNTIAIFMMLFAALPLRGQPSPGIPSDTTSGISFPNSPANDVLSFYERLTGKRIIRDNSINDLKVTVFANEPMKKDQAAQFVESALLLNGVALIPAGDNTFKALNTATRKPGSEVVPLMSGAEGVPPTDEVVSYFMPLRFLNPEDAKKIFMEHVPLHDYGAITVAPGRSALLITENARLVRRFIELQELIDKEPATIVNQFVQLQRADAERVAELVTKAVTDSGKAPSANASGGSGASKDTAAEETRLVADARTNRILVITKPSNFVLIRSLIEQFDTPAALIKPMMRTLYYIPAVETLPSLVDMLSDKSDKGEAETQKTAIEQKMPQSTVSGGQRAQPISEGYPAGGGGSSGKSLSRADQLSAPAEMGAPVSVTVGKTLLVANPQANSILVSGPPENVERVNQMLDKLDRRPKQVYLATIIGQFTLGDGMEFGIDWLVHYSQNNGTGAAGSFITSAPFAGLAGNNANTAAGSQVSTSTSVVPNLGGALNPTQLLNPAAFTNLISGLTVYGVIGDAVTYYVRALESSGRFKILSRPVVYTTNNKKAKIANGQKVPIPATTLTSLSTSATTPSVASSIDYQDVLLKLEVIPLINANGEVTLQIAQTNDNIQGNQQISGNSVPIIGTQELNTTVTLKNRQTVVLGGLVSETSRKDRRGLPLLMDIPYAGYLFSNTKIEKVRQELIIFIQPIIVDEPEGALEVTRREKERTSLPSEIESLIDYETHDQAIEIRKAIPVSNKPPRQ